MRFWGIIPVLIVTVIAFFSIQYHFIILEDGLKILKKAEPQLANTIVDGRGAANMLKILTNPVLLKAGVNELIDGEGTTIRPKKSLKEAYKNITD